MPVINSAKDLQAIHGTALHASLMEYLAGTIHRYEWENGAWKLVKDTSVIEKYGLDVADFPDAPVPEKPTKDLDAEANEAEAANVRKQRNAMLSASDWTQLPDVDAVVQQVWAEYRQELRDLPEQEGFPFDVNWPVAPE